MQKEFRNFYPNTSDINYPLDFLKSIVTSHSAPVQSARHSPQSCQAAVCQIRGKFYRCNVEAHQSANGSEQFLVSSIDYGFKELVDIEQIYPPMLKFVCFLVFMSVYLKLGNPHAFI
jgi:hypothetical protein